MKIQETRKSYDIAIIGSGAGLMVAEVALQAGLRVALIEKSKIGGTCLTKGCIPSKMLVYPADLIREASTAMRIGLKFEAPEIDWKKVSDRMWRQIDYSDRMENNLDSIDNLDVYKGYGEFVNHNTLKVKLNTGEYSDEFHAEKIVVAAGAYSFIPNIDGLEEVGYITSESFFGEKFPYERPWKSLIIIGSGAIGAEFAHIFSAFGTDVTIISKDQHILSSEDEEVRSFVKEQFESSGIKVKTNTNTISASAVGGEKTIVVKNTLTGETETLRAEEIFVAAGVRSFAPMLKPENAGIALDEQGWIRTDEYLNTTRKGIYAIGDINGKYKFRHTANYEAEVLINNLFTNNPTRKAYYDSVPWAIFTNPQIGHVGITEQQAKEKGIPYVVKRNSFSSIATGFSMGYDSDRKAAGFAKLISDGNGKLLGVHIVGPQAAALVQPFVYLMNISPEESELPDKKLFSKVKPDLNAHSMLAPIRRSMVIHPSLNELTAWAIEGL